MFTNLITMSDAYEILNLINKSEDLEYQEISYEGGTYIFDEILCDTSEWIAEGTCDSRYRVYELSLVSEDELIGLGTYYGQGVTRCSSYFSDYEYYYEEPELVEKKVEDAVVEKWVPIKSVPTKVMSGFPGVGKSHLFREQSISDLSILDSDSSNFSWVLLEDGTPTKERHPEFPDNYVEHINSYLGKCDILCVSSHKVVRDALKDKLGNKFVVAYPDKSLKEDYLLRYKKRGSSDQFIDMIANNWNAFIDEIENDSDLLKLKLNHPSVYASDAFSRDGILKLLHTQDYDSVMDLFNCSISKESSLIGVAEYVVYSRDNAFASRYIMNVLEDISPIVDRICELEGISS